MHPTFDEMKGNLKVVLSLSFSWEPDSQFHSFFLETNRKFSVKVKPPLVYQKKIFAKSCAYNLFMLDNVIKYTLHVILVKKS